MIWKPNATVATIVEKDGQYLVVEETSNGKTVYNQPAGHIEEGESILDAALRETLEETGWQVKLTGLVGMYTYHAPHNGRTYYRFCFAATALEKITDTLDEDITAAHWMSLEQLEQLEREQQSLRSPLVLKCIKDYHSRDIQPLDLIYEHPRE